MSLRCLVILSLSLAVRSASIASRNIPVEVVYERASPLVYSTRNLDAKIQLTSDELLKLKLSDDVIDAEKELLKLKLSEDVIDAEREQLPGVRNLDEKVQLSPEELGLAVKFLPNLVEQDEAVKVVDEKAVQVQEVKPRDNLLELLKRAEQIAYSGVNAIRDNIDKASEAASNAKPGAETWVKLNSTLNDFFADQYKRASLKADNAPDNQSNNNNENNQIVNFFQGFLVNLQSAVNNLQGPSTAKPGGSEDEQTAQPGGQNFAQIFISFVSNGVSQMVSNFNNQNSNNGTSEDTGTGGGNNFFTNVGAFFQGILPQGQGSNPSNQSDTGVQPPPSNPITIFQQTISNAIGNLIPQQASSQKPVQGDEGTATSTTQSSIFGINNINQAISSGIQTISQLGQGGGSGGGGSGGGLDQITAIGTQIGQQLTGQGQGSNPIQQAVGQLTGQGEQGSNPVQAIGSQIGQLAGQGGGGNNPIQAIGSQIGQVTNPIEGIQNAIGGLSPSTEKAKVGEQKDELVTPDPTTSPKEVLEVAGVEKKPAVVEEKPAQVEKKPAEVKEKPAEIEKKPAEVEKKPAEVVEKVE